MLPETQAYLDQLRAQCYGEWDCYTPECDIDRAADLVLGLIQSFGLLSFNSAANSAAHRQAVWLAVFAARRALPCWDLYCDGAQPHEAIDSILAWLTGKGSAEACRRYEVEAIPAYRGQVIDDCRSCDTGAVAESVAWAAKFVNSVDPIDASLAIHMADVAFDQSPLGEADHFRSWLFEVAIPAAVQQRELNEAEQTAFRDYNASQIGVTRKEDGHPTRIRSVFRWFSLHSFLDR